MPQPQASRRFALQLFALALLTRLLWVLFVHPPGEHVFSDMARYLERATTLAQQGPQWERGVEARPWAWQAWGTHTLMAAIMKLTSTRAPYTALALAWAVIWATVVPLTYALAARALTPRHARAVGWAALLWIPHLTLGGYFTSEGPFCVALLWATLSLSRLWSEGRGTLAAATSVALCFCLRPQVALFALLAIATWAHAFRRGTTLARPAQVCGVALALAVAIGFSMWRFSVHTGYAGGVAENANMNLTAARCHNVVTQAFETQADLDRSNARASTLDGRRVSLPGFRLLASTTAEGTHHPLELRPALGGESIKFVGYIGDAKIHREIRARCYAAQGWLEQVRKSVVNLSLLWVLNYQWPEVGDRKAAPWYRGLSQVAAWVFALVFWIPSVFGCVMALGAQRREENPAMALCALQLLSLMALAAIFFGTLRLRTPYDPFALILAWPWLARVLAHVRKAAPELENS